MDKLYERINWENEPSISTPLNEINLNKMDYSIDAIDDRVITIDTTKAKQSDLLQSLKTVTYDTSSGVFLFTWNNGTTLTVDLNIEKIPVSFSMSEAGVITMTTADGSTYTADVASLIKTYSFTDSSRIDFTVTTDASGNKTVQADIVDGSITSSKIEASLVANINNANNYAISSKSYAVGGTGTRSGENTDNSKYYYEQARQTDVGQLVPRVTNLETGLSNTMESLTQLETDNSDWLKGKNLIDSRVQFVGQYYDSSFVVENSRLTTDYIAIYPNTNYMASADVNLRHNLALINYNYFDSNKTWLGNRATNGDSAFSGQHTKLINISNTSVAYIRITYRCASNADVNISTYSLKDCEVQLEKGNTFSGYEPYSLPNTDLTKLRDKDINQYFKGANLLNPSLQTSTINGVTCTKNADGTFTVNGTASSTAVFILNTYSLESGTYKLCGCPSNGTVNSYYMDWRADDNIQLVDSGNGSAYTSSGQSGKQVRIIISGGYTANNLVFKPMMTKYTNLGYNDFVPYEDSSNRVLKESLANQGTWSTSSASEIGMYGDKKLYRKIFTKSATGDGTNVVAYSISTGIGSSAKIKHIYGIARRASDGLMYIIPYVQLAVSQFVSVFVDNSGWIQIRMKTSDTAEYNFEITVEYTE